MKKEEFEKMSPEEQEKMLDGIKSVQDAQDKIKQDDSKLPQLDMKQFGDIINNAIEKRLKGMSDADKKYHMFPGAENVIDDKLKNDTSKEGKFAKTKAFFNALVGKDVQTLNAMHQSERVKANLSEGTTTAGGFLVPEEFSAEIQRLAPLYGVIRRNARIIPMRYDTMNIPAAGTTDQSAIWTNEAAQILQTDPNFRQLVLTINKLAALPKMTSELLADANSDVINYLAMLISEAFAKEEDNQGFNGTGSPFVGCLSATGVPTSPHAGGTGIICLSYTDLVQTTGRIYTNALANAKFYFHRTVVAHLRSRIATTGAPILLPNQSEIGGFPFELTEILPGTGHASAQTDAFAYAVFGDLRRGLAMGERGSMTMKLLEEGTVGSDNLGEKDMVALRVIERVCLGVLLPSAFTRLVT